MMEMTQDVIARNRILAVDDEEVWRNFLTTKLARAGIEHSIVEDEQAAIEALVPDSYTGVITDGLYGGWRNVFAAADQIGAKAVLLSADDALVSSVLSLGNRQAVDKGASRSIDSAIRAVLL